MTARIAVLGSANMDLVVTVARPAGAGETVFGSSFATTPGGKGLNQAVASARAGADVAFLGAVGTDAFGETLRTTLESDGIDTANLARVDGETGIASIMVTSDAENSIVVVAGANAEDAFTDGDREAIARASHLVAQLERPISLVVDAFRFAKQRGVVTVLTPAPIRADLEQLLAVTDILIANQHEATQLADIASPVEAAAALSARLPTVVVTLGAKGVVVARSGRLVATVDAHEVAAVDTTGAGDTFAGVLIAWLAAGETLDDALRAATAAASIAVTRRGAAASMPHRDEILAALTDHPSSTHRSQEIL